MLQHLISETHHAGYDFRCETVEGADVSLTAEILPTSHLTDPQLGRAGLLGAFS